MPSTNSLQVYEKTPSPDAEQLSVIDVFRNTRYLPVSVGSTYVRKSSPVSTTALARGTLFSEVFNKNGRRREENESNLGEMYSRLWS